jgi:methylase of polypeptide subunit release factors
MQQARKRLNPGGAVFFEIGEGQADVMRSLAQKFLSPCTVEIKKDLCDRDRVVCVKALSQNNLINFISSSRHL